MDYKTARPLIQSGDIIAFRRDGIVSSVIRAATRSDYSHVGIAWPVAGRVMLLEATLPSIRIFPLSKAAPFHWISLSKPLTPEAEEYALSRVGERYSVAEAMMGYFGLARPDQRWQCAEYVRSVLSLQCRETPTGVVNEALRLNGTIHLVQK